MNTNAMYLWMAVRGSLSVAKQPDVAPSFGSGILLVISVISTTHR